MMKSPRGKWKSDVRRSHGLLAMDMIPRHCAGAVGHGGELLDIYLGLLLFALPCHTKSEATLGLKVDLPISSLRYSEL